MIQRKKRRKLLIMGAAMLAMVTLLTGCSKSSVNNSGEKSEVEDRDVTVEDSSDKLVKDTENASPTVVDDDLIIQISKVSETAKFYPVEVDGIKLEVIAVKDTDGTIRTAFNTCQVCFDSGRGYYEQDGDQLVCQNCGNRFKMEQVEVKAGGCNPVPIFPENKTIDEETITISEEYLKESAVIFENWKTS